MPSAPLDSAPLVDQLFVSRRNRWSLYLALVLLAGTIRLASFMGLLLTDDLWYSQAAQKIAQGNFEPRASHIGLRIGLTIPVGVVYRLFGASEWTTILVPLLASSLTIPLLVAVGRRIFSNQAALLAGLLLATLPTHVISGTELIPEPVLELCILLGVMTCLKASRQGDSAAIAALAGICFGVAYLAKEIGLFVGAAFFLYSAARGKWRLALALGGGMAAVGALEVIFYLISTGDPLFRPHVIAKSQEEYFRGNFGPLNWRLFKLYPYMMLVPNREFGFHSLMAVCLALASPFIVRGERVWMVLTWAAVPMLYLNFGSSSFSSYEPVAAAERYIVLVYYPLLLLAGAVLSQWLSKPGFSRYQAYGILLLLGLAGIAGAMATAGLHVTVDEMAFRAILACGPWVLLAGAMIRSWRVDPEWPRHALWSVFMLVILTGCLGALAYRNYWPSFPEIRALRGIVERAEQQSFQIVRVEGKRARQWRLAVELLSGPRPGIAECTSRCLVIAPDALGIPVATEVSGAALNVPHR